MRKIAGLLVLTMFFAGCASVAIKPTELPKLNSTETVISERDSGQIKLSSAAQVETPDGRLVEIKGKSDVIVQLKDSSSMTFKYPIKSSVESQSVTIMSSNLPKTTIPLEKIQSVEVSQVNYAVADVTLFVLGFAVTAAIGYLLIHFVAR